MKNVMLIEDDHNLQFLYDKLITLAGYTVCNKSISAEQAFAYYFKIKEKPSIIISDFHIQGKKTGVDVALSILMENPTQKFLFVTGDKSLVTRNRHSDTLRHIPVLLKPFALNDLIHSLNHLVQAERKDQFHEKDH